MNPIDNTTPHPSSEYDEKVRQTIPYYELFHYETIELALSICPNAKNWLDAGCGTGFLIEKALPCFKNTHFYLADPSLNMLNLALKRLLQNQSQIHFLDPIGSENLDQIHLPKFDIITSIQAHHYLKKEMRAKSLQNLYNLLNDQGLIVIFENISPDSQDGITYGLKRWMNFQIQQGRPYQEVIEHVQRFNTEYFPITVQDHIELLKKSGFKIVELFRYSYMQAGFFAIK